MLSDESLAGATPAMVQRLFGRECPVPLADERARFLAEVGHMEGLCCCNRPPRVPLDLTMLGR